MTQFSFDSRSSTAFLLLFTFIIALHAAESENESNADVCSTPICESESQSILAKLDESVDPCDDFYHFACGSFINNSVIPDDKSQIDVSTLLDQTLKEQLNEILNSSISADDIHPFVCSKKIYQACINEGEMDDTHVEQPTNAKITSNYRPHRRARIKATYQSHRIAWWLADCGREKLD